MGPKNILAPLYTAPHKLGDPGLGPECSLLRASGLAVGWGNSSGLYWWSETVFCNALGHSRISHSRGRDFCKSYTNLFSRSSSRPGMFSGLFFRDGRVIGLSRVFRSLCIPLGISVD